MTDTQGEGVRGLRAAAKLVGCSPSGLQKMVDNGDVPARKVDGVYVFASADLEALGAVSTRADTVESAPEISPQEGSPGPTRQVEPVAPGSSEAAPVQESRGSNDGEIAAAVFADLTAGKDLRTIVVERKLAPAVVQRWHQEWLRLTQIDGLKTPAAERRLVALEVWVDVLKRSNDSMFGELGDFRDRVAVLEGVLGIETRGSQTELSES